MVTGNSNGYSNAILRCLSHDRRCSAVSRHQSRDVADSYVGRDAVADHVGRVGDECDIDMIESTSALSSSKGRELNPSSEPWSILARNI